MRKLVIQPGWKIWRPSVILRNAPNLLFRFLIEDESNFPRLRLRFLHQFEEAVTYNSQKGKDWLITVKTRENLVTESFRLFSLLRLYDWYSREYKSNRNIVIFSQLVKFLDIVEKALLRTYQVNRRRDDNYAFIWTLCYFSLIEFSDFFIMIIFWHLYRKITCRHQSSWICNCFVYIFESWIDLDESFRTMWISSNTLSI